MQDRTVGRSRVLHEIAEQALSLRSAEGVARIAVDGVDGAGKTVFAGQLADLLQALGAPVIRASVDSFHNPRAVRYRLGKDSPLGFFRDSYNYSALRRLLLDPLSPGGSLRYRTAAFDHLPDSEVEAPEEIAAPGSLLVFDGIFLHRQELVRYWDLSIFLDVPFTVSIPRGNARFGTSPDPDAPSNRRYVEGQKIYLAECTPCARATIVVNNEELARPYIVS